MADVCLKKTEVVTAQQSIEIMSTKFGLLIEFELPKAVTSTYETEVRNTKSQFSGRDRHLEKWI